MMGGFQSNSAAFVAPWLLVGVLAASSATAESSPDGPTHGRPTGAASLPAADVARAATDAEAPDARVSTSPETNAATPATSRPASALAIAADAPPPLTRAAARQRVESISPLPWLARFGPVSLEHRE
jgi:hypothetical protein